MLAMRLSIYRNRWERIEGHVAFVSALLKCAPCTSQRWPFTAAGAVWVLDMEGVNVLPIDVLRDSSARSYECRVSFSGWRIRVMTTEQLLFCCICLFVVMTEVVGGMQTSGGVGAGSVLYFPLAFVKSRASHVARFCFSESLWGLRGLRAACPTTPGLVLSHVGRGVGQVLAFFSFFCRDHQVLP